MLRTIAGRTTHSARAQSISFSDSHPITKYTRHYSPPHDFSVTGDNALKQPKARMVNSTPIFFHDRGESHGAPPHPTNFSQPLFVDIEQSKQAFSEATWNRLNLITPLLMAFQARGIGNFVRESGAGNFNTAVHTLLQATRVLLCTGFNVAENMPETDGPLGTALLAYACFRAEKYVALVADTHNAHLLREQLFFLDPACARNISIEEVKANNQEPSGSWEYILDRHQPDAVVHTEVPGRNKDGKYLNMRGIQISDFNAALDEIADLANARRINTIAVGDGGNEAGMGQIKGVSKALNKEEMQAVIPAAHQVIAWNSNLGAIAMGEFVMSAAGKGPSCTERDFEKMLRILFKEGAVDGITRGKKLNEKIENPAFSGQYNFTCVDGARSAIHIGNLLQVQDIAHNFPLTFPVDTNKKTAL
ncbi:glutamate cyclase domain-containing protein [Noviherbaspirillum soli]|uniref:glutamate cyclase domain-containing protein n=1 Tax=Noviherbaspirillum soli TaxID=1064518 RepID=UPI00188DC511|nr:glutamate cyclase domain-containing protein [Noviherbaspirillum soli]